MSPAATRDLSHAQAYNIASQRIFDMMGRLGIHMSFF